MKLVLNPTMWRLCEEAGYDMSQYVESAPLLEGSNQILREMPWVEGHFCVRVKAEKLGS